MLIAFIGMVPFLPTMTVAVIFIVLCFMFVIRYVLLANDNSCLEQVGLYLFIFILVNMYTGITSITRTVSIKIALITTLFMLVFYIIYFFVNSSKKFYSMVFILATSAMFTGFYGLYQKYSGLMDATWLDKELFEGVALRVFSTFGNPNVYGEYILLILPIVFAMIFVSKKIVAKLYYLFISAILLFNLLLTLSRGCYLALALAFFVFICLINVRLISLFIIGLFAIMPLLSDIVISRIVSITNFSDSSTSFRLMIWQGTLRMLKDFWFVGLGQGEAAFNSVYPLYSFNTVFAPHAHNVYLQIFVEMGILGLIIFIGLITVFLKTIISYKCKSLDDKFITAGFYAAFSGFLFQGLFDYVFYNYRIFLIFFIILGLSIAFINIKKREHIYDKGYKYNI
jgi:O-antigen ligase